MADMPQQAENEVEETTEQESPTVEEKPSDDVEAESGENLEETPADAEDDLQDRNWRAVREELEKLKKENESLKKRDAVDSSFDQAKESEALRAFITDKDSMALQLDEFKAAQTFPELDDAQPDKYDPLFDAAVGGKYRAALDKYAHDLLMGKQSRLPSPTAIAREVKAEWDKRLGSVDKKAKEEGARAAKEAVAKKEATVEAEGRSDRKAKEMSSDEMTKLREASRRGDFSAVAERLKRAGL